ncbi:ABC transporter substrate-binding protein [Kineococcus sp. GCM10028916]|uniref:ABC transporter substrate-binding protein n=1 Tax=Kineococcus sp. GCM10028916 TaxID=3273394 RepID=UPI0036395898
MARSVTRRGLAAAVVLVSATSLVLAGCGGDDSEAATTGSSAADTSAPLYASLPADVQKAGKLTVATSVGYPPFEQYDTDGKTIVGIDADIAKALGGQLGVPLELQDTKFDGIIPGLAAGRYDMAMSGMSDTAERQQQVSFVDYFAAGPGILTTPAKAAEYTGLDALCGVAVAVSSGTVNADDAAAQSTKCEAEGKAPIEVTTYGADSESIQALKTGRADVFLVDSSSGATVAAQSAGAFVMGPKYQEIPFGIVVPKGSTELVTAIQKAMQALKADGTYTKVLADWDQPQGELDAITVNGSAVS